MALQPDPTPTNPARDAAILLGRIGYLILFVGLPIAAFGARIAPVIVFSIAIPVVAAGTVVGGGGRRVRAALADLGRSLPALALAFAAGWAVLSLAWSPPGTRSPLGSGTLGTVAIALLGLLGYLSLPDRMRAANLYPAAIGAGLAVLLAIGLAFGPSGESAESVGSRLERGLSVLVLFAWPAIGLLRSRRRDAEAIVLAIAAALAAALAPGPVIVASFAAGAIAYGLVQLSPRGGSLAVGIALALIVLAAPALLWLAAHGYGPVGKGALGGWPDALFRSPGRLLTGHGAGALRSDPTGVAFAPIFGGPLLATWYELGVVGAAATALALGSLLRSVSGPMGPLRPALAGALVTGGLVMLTGVDRGALWWPVAIATAALLFVAAERGQFRTRRPRAFLFGARIGTAPAAP